MFGAFEAARARDVGHAHQPGRLVREHGMALPRLIAALSLSRLRGTLSVRARIAVLAFIPVLGFLASGIAIERVINKGMADVSENDAGKLMLSLIVMRRFEAEHRLHRMGYLQQMFAAEFDKLGETLGALDMPAAGKAELAKQAKTYVDAFAEWSALVDKAAPLVTFLNLDVQQMVPLVDNITAKARAKAQTASADLATSQARTRTVLIVVGVTAVGLGLALSLMIGRGITRPLHRLAGAMTRLAQGNAAIDIPATEA